MFDFFKIIFIELNATTEQIHLMVNKSSKVYIYLSIYLFILFLGCYKICLYFILFYFKFKISGYLGALGCRDAVRFELKYFNEMQP